ncbi:MAG: pyridoxamine 5'-phosphate oxidase family protein [Leptospirales bacterium]|jgi:nitroimidazol reductase NimA-like FMN-containing flavoprotein (pyridoxamine 5'-phosphate oxidase superfamily)
MEYSKTKRTTVVRAPRRAVYDRERVHAILDEAMICHVGFAGPDGRPFVLPTAYGRDGELLYLHGAAASRMMRSLAAGVPICVTVTLLDGLVLARSAFHHSVNYRSVVLFGQATLVEDIAEKERALRLFTDHIVPDRWDAVRGPTPQELKATTVLSMPIEEVSAKVRTGPPNDDDEDYALPIWAGILPCAVQYAAPIDDGRLAAGTEMPDHISLYRRP